MKAISLQEMGRWLKWRISTREIFRAEFSLSPSLTPSNASNFSTQQSTQGIPIPTWKIIPAINYDRPVITATTYKSWDDPSNPTPPPAIFPPFSQALMVTAIITPSSMPDCWAVAKTAKACCHKPCRAQALGTQGPNGGPKKGTTMELAQREKAQVEGNVETLDLMAISFIWNMSILGNYHGTIQNRFTFLLE